MGIRLFWGEGVKADALLCYEMYARLAASDYPRAEPSSFITSTCGFQAEASPLTRYPGSQLAEFTAIDDLVLHMNSECGEVGAEAGDAHD